jgi:hypothetical protein
MIALFDFLPNFCPNCGAETVGSFEQTESDRQCGLHPHHDYNFGASHSCDCGLMFQKCDTQAMIDASDAYGDLKQYA